MVQTYKAGKHPYIKKGYEWAPDETAVCTLMESLCTGCFLGRGDRGGDEGREGRELEITGASFPFSPDPELSI